MQVEELYWKRPRRTRLYGKLSLPDGSLYALVIMVHGIGEHSGCYDSWAEKFAQQRVGFLAFDMRGHGCTTGRRGHATVKAVKDDLRMMIREMRGRFPGIPVVLFGHSMGGHIVLSYATDANVAVQGMIASSPWLELLAPPSRAAVKLAGMASCVVPWFTVPTGIRADQLANDVAEVKSSKTDPLLHKKISIGLFTDLWTGSKAIVQHKYRLNVPLLLMYGTADQLVSFRAGESFVEEAGKYAEYKQWEGMSHNLLNDANSETVFQYIMKWMQQQWNRSGQ